ncbi:glycosyltransferase [Leuconostoc gelidum]|uniref:glycosyltransferase n=1 Tax=Leuconostoc gelidum TaxID=1244 RepID=UPI001CC6C85A|nr:glycosyltransferase [Leuconostoc gelidum]MBZ6001563.1 glycosyltransferase [Leuconostoc gelidum subsp. gelidum]
MKDKIPTIMVVAPNLSGKGGTETVLTKIINYEKYEVNMTFKLFLSDGTTDEDWLTQLKLKKKNLYLNKYHGFRKNLKKITFFIFNRDDLILALGPKTILLAWIVRIAFFKKYKIISWIHFSLVNGHVKHANLLKLADKHLAISTGIVQQLMDMGIDHQKIYKIYNPVEKEDTTIPVSGDDIRRIVYVGRMTYDGQKNLNFLMKAMSKLPQYLTYELDMYGDGQDIDRLKNYCINILDDNIQVNWYGWVDNPWTAIQEADILVLTSTYEGFGMVLAEAISRGLPVVSTDAPVGPSDIIKNGENGFLVELENIDDFAYKMNYAIEYFHNMDKLMIKRSISQLYEDSFYPRLENALSSMLND